MRVAAGLLATFFGVFIALLLQQALPPINAFDGARWLFVPTIFCLAAISLPFPAMLAAALFTGFFCDLAYLHVVGGQVEIALGCSIIFFVVLGSIANGFRPSFERGRWWPLIPLSALGTSAFLLLQFAMISLRRQSLEFEAAVAWRILMPGALAAVFSLALYFAVRQLAALLPASPFPGRGF